MYVGEGSAARARENVVGPDRLDRLAPAPSESFLPLHSSRIYVCTTELSRSDVYLGYFGALDVQDAPA